jgi:hypothetical protein
MPGLATKQCGVRHDRAKQRTRAKSQMHSNPGNKVAKIRDEVDEALEPSIFPGWKGCWLNNTRLPRGLNALQKLLHKPFKISEAFAAVSGPFGLRVSAVRC